jgi:hypothetical protein
MEHHPSWLGSTGEPRIRYRDRLLGQNVADNHRHTVARAHLLTLLWADPRVEDWVNQWSEQTGLGLHAHLLAQGFESLAQAMGIDHRSKLWDLILSGRVRCTLVLQHLPQEWAGIFGAVALDPLVAVEHWKGELWHHLTELVPAAISLVHSNLRLPWPWLVAEVIDEFSRTHLSHIVGRRVSRVFEWHPPDPPAPPFAATFETQPGESVSTARARLDAEYQWAKAQLDEAEADFTLPRGHAPRDETTRAEVTWFYRRLLRGESTRHIALTDDRDRATVSSGIKEAERLLNLTGYHWPAPGEQEPSEKGPPVPHGELPQSASSPITD